MVVRLSRVPRAIHFFFEMGETHQPLHRLMDVAFLLRYLAIFITKVLTSCVTQSITVEHGRHSI